MDVKASEPVITIAGCGPGAASYLTLQVMEEVARAEVLVGASRLLGLFSRSKVQKLTVGADVAAVLDRIEDCWRQKRVVVLTTGDPGLYSLATAVLERFGHASCRIIPGISSVQLALARLALSWVEARVISAHRDLPDIEPARLDDWNTVAVLMGHPGAFAWVRALLGRMGSNRRIFVCQDLSLAGERIEKVKPDDLADGVYSGRSIVVLTRKRERE